MMPNILLAVLLLYGVLNKYGTPRYDTHHSSLNHALYVAI